MTNVNELVGTRSHHLIQAAKDPWEFCLQRHIHLTVEVLPEVHNTIADTLTREYGSWNNWRMDAIISKRSTGNGVQYG